MQAVTFPELGCTVYGAAFTAPELPEDHVLAGFTAPEDGLIHIGLLHGDVTGGDSRYRPLTTASIAASGLDYLALGHVHGCTGAVRAGRVTYGYCGCPEGRGFDELGDRGFLYGDIGPGTAELRFVAFARRRYRVWEADVTDGEALAAVERMLPQDTAEDICRLRLVGAPEEPVSLPLLEWALAGRFFALQLRDDTTVRREVWDRCGEDTLRGLFLQELRREYDGADEETRRRIELAARFGVAINFRKPSAVLFREIVLELAKRQLPEIPDEEELLRQADAWALRHGGVSGRVAQQLIDSLAGSC